MDLRTFGRTGRRVSQLGVGMWGMGGGIGGWTGADDRHSMAVLQTAVDSGVAFFDSAQVYGAGHSDQLLGALARANPDRDLLLASKIPPKNRQWPARPGDVTTVIPGMRSLEHLALNLAAEADGPLTPDLVAVLRAHRWDRAQSRASMS